MSHPWSGRFSATPDAAFLAFSSSLAEDRPLIREDIVGSLAHARGLLDAGVVTPAEHDALAKGLRAVYRDLVEGRAKLRQELEDVHMNVETLLAKHAGAVAGKLHTGRSRNDQVALDLRLFTRSGLLALAQELLAYSETLLEKADRHADLAMPGYTHLQPAMPVTLGHMLHAHAERAVRDAERALDAFRRANVSALGAAALAGTSYPIDPARTAELLGFDRAFANSLDAVSDRDSAAEALFVCALTATHLSGLGEELVLFTSPAYGYLKLPEDLTTGSSIMPQKRNPDAAELLRGRAGRSLAALVAVLATLKSLPLAYNRDLQETKGPLVNALPYAIASVQMARMMIEGVEPVPARMQAALLVGFLEATELADLLAQKGMPFREAHHVVGALVKESEMTGTPLATLAAKHPAYHGADLSGFGPQQAAARKTSPGGTAPARVREAVAEARARVAALQQRAHHARARVEAAERALLEG
ncbi:MAG TPA: argininosuccinate lyase [Candidatus Thermoplasmatota archaeon]|nr:argininosuccinate lyase [Candidatus Thermoplasmatota archaeon]